MEHIFIIAENARFAHYYAEGLGFKRGQYQAVTDFDRMRGLRECTLFVLPRADLNPVYARVYSEAVFSRFTIIFIDDETLDIIEGVAYTEASHN
ncbi:hypothetical protein pf16_135 [Pseudomonas phage pf16]|uniref:Uncharacterized protein n=1 Tax=Pseudomonas phage pf16 TaxID=1815630 RepID=A0A1S5R3S4_9CAUD|nr:hypothetical protein FDG98_gp163 [Pseudomonas phage pf16]AND75058.1 hypothetical protein pf16_135 [Pseudomonas phage pf16]